MYTAIEKRDEPTELTACNSLRRGLDTQKRRSRSLRAGSDLLRNGSGSRWRSGAGAGGLSAAGDSW
jgi:hypothetical protein